MNYTDNVRFNLKISIFILIISALTIKEFSILFTLIYMFASAFIQPDLDLVKNRAGETSFPIGNTIKKYKIGQILSIIFYPINRLWFFFWTPYALLLTHRGISHFPIIGTFSRIFYVDFFIFIINLIFNLHIKYLHLYFIDIHSFYWQIYCLPIFIADIIHIFIDFYDSIKNNTRFSSYAHSPGLIIQLFNPKIIKYHTKALKKAKSNQRKRKKK